MDYPLLFKFTDSIEGLGFVARVAGLGRVLMTFDGGAWFCRGVEPGGIVSQGSNAGGAYAAFRQTLADVIEDIAEESKSFETFQVRVPEFFMDTNTAEAQRWNRALEVLRASKSQPEEPFDQLPRWKAAEHSVGVQIERVGAFVQEEQVVALADPLPEAA